jgi:hypothetical protein
LPRRDELSPSKNNRQTSLCQDNPRPASHRTDEQRIATAKMGFIIVIVRDELSPEECCFEVSTVAPESHSLPNLFGATFMPFSEQISSIDRKTCFLVVQACGMAGNSTTSCRQGAAVLIGMLLLFSLLSMKKGSGLQRIHHRKLGGHDMVYVDPENPEVCKAGKFQFLPTRSKVRLGLPMAASGVYVKTSCTGCQGYSRR